MRPSILGAAVPLRRRKRGSAAGEHRISCAGIARIAYKKTAVSNQCAFELIQNTDSVKSGFAAIGVRSQMRQRS